MQLEPQKLFTGLMDFFSILLPGALLTYMFKDEVGPHLIGTVEYSNLKEAEAWSIFFFASYLLGHLIFLVGSKLFDKYLYDRVRNSTYANQVAMLADGKSLSPKWLRWMVAA